MKVYCSANSNYFFARGVLYRFQKPEEGIIWSMNPVLYASPGDIITAINEQGIKLDRVNEPGKLEKFVQKLKEKEKSMGEVGGRFVGPGRGEDKGKILYSTAILRFEDRPQEELSRLLI